MDGGTLLDSMLGVSESFQPVEVVFPLHHLLNQAFPVRKKLRGLDPQHQALPVPVPSSDQWSEGASSCQLRVPAMPGEGSSSQDSFSFHKHSQCG